MGIYILRTRIAQLVHHPTPYIIIVSLATSTPHYSLIKSHNELLISAQEICVQIKVQHKIVLVEFQSPSAL